MRHRRALAILLVGSLLLWEAPSRAQDDPQARQVEKLATDAAAAYRAADYQRAVGLFERAYEIRQVGALLYNLAKAYDKLGNADKAVELYRRYCDSTEADPKLRDKAEARIAAYDETHRKKEPPTFVDAQLETPPPDRDPARLLQEWNARRRRDRIVGLTLVSVGVASALAGMGLSLHANSLRNDFASTLDTEAEKRGERDAARTQALVGDVLYGVAAASVAVSIYFLWRGYHKESPPKPSAWLAPAISPSGAGLVLRGGF